MSDRDAMMTCPTLERLEPVAMGDRSDAGVEQHLSSCDVCRRTVEQLRADNEFLKRFVGHQGATTAGGRPNAPEIATTVEGFEILGEIHRGGQGVIFKAVQSATKRKVALKMLLGGVSASERQRRRFEREIELVAGLHHPFIVTLFDSGVTAKGEHYFAMEYVRGVPLDRYLRQPSEVHKDEDQPRPINENLRLFAKVCEAVQCAHLRGIIHRDLKPENILVDAAGDPHVLDFGLARILGRDMSSGDWAITQTGEFMGTFSYAAPEQVKGDPEQIDTRTDVYALGVILYEMLTGQSPYPMSVSLSDLIYNIAEREPKRPSLCCRQIGDEVETIILTCLKKDREQRYQSAGELLRDVRSYLAGEPIAAKRNSAWYVLRKVLARHRIRAAVVSAFLGLAVLFAGQWYGAVEARKTVLVLLRDSFADAETQRRGKSELTAREALDRIVCRADKAALLGPEFAAEFHHKIGTHFKDMGVYDNAEQHLNKAISLRRRHFGNLSNEYADSVHALGAVYYYRDDFLQAEKLYNEAFESRKYLFGPRHKKIADSLNNLASCKMMLGRDDEAEEHYRDALQMRREKFGDSHPEVARSLSNLGNFLRKQGRYKESEHALDEAFSIMENIVHVEKPGDVARVNERRGALLVDTKRCSEAIGLLKDSLPMKRLALDADDPTIDSGLHELARYYVVCDPNPEEAEKHGLDALSRREKRQREHHEVGESRHLLGKIRLLQDKPEEAETELRAAVDLLRKTWPTGYAEIAETEIDLGICLTRLKRYEEAEIWLKKHVDPKSDANPRHRAIAANAARLLADLYDAWDKPREAADLRSRAVAQPSALVSPK